MDEAGVINLADEMGMNLLYWHVMDSGKDSVDLLQQLLDRFGTGLQLRAGAQPGARQRLQRARAVGRAGARDRDGRASRFGQEAARGVDPEDRRHEQQLLAGQGGRRTRPASA